MKSLLLPVSIEFQKYRKLNNNYQAPNFNYICCLLSLPLHYQVFKVILTRKNSHLLYPSTPHQHFLKKHFQVFFLKNPPKKNGKNISPPAY